MKRMWMIALVLLGLPASVSAQVELGLDFFGINYTDIDGQTDKVFGVGMPVSGMRVGFMINPQAILETRIEGDWDKQGDTSLRGLTLIPGLNYLVNEQLYVRGEAGLMYSAFDPGTGSVSDTQWAFGGGVGTRRALGMGVLRLEAGVQKVLEGDASPSALNIYGSAGASVVIN